MVRHETITIKGESYKIGFSFRAIREYELLSSQSISKCVSTWDNLLFIYSTLRALNEHFTMSVDEFTDIMDEESDLFIQLQTFAVQKNIEPQKEPQIEVKKKTLKSIFGLWMLSLLLCLSPALAPITFGIIWIWLSILLFVKLLTGIFVILGKGRAS